MKEIKILLNLLINYIGKVNKIIKSIKLNMKVYVLFLLNMWLKIKMNLFYKYEHKN